MKSYRPPIGSTVIVRTKTSTFTGKLMGMSETEVYLKSATRTWAIPTTDVKEVVAQSESLNKNKLEIPASYWNDDIESPDGNNSEK